jgi:hypothetical protein
MNEDRCSRNRLVEQGKIVRNAVGWYSPPHEEESSDLIDTSKEFPELEKQQGGSSLLAPNETIGEGDELVYIYYQVSELKWAEHEGRIFWSILRPRASRVRAQIKRCALSVRARHFDLSKLDLSKHSGS